MNSDNKGIVSTLIRSGTFSRCTHELITRSNSYIRWRRISFIGYVTVISVTIDTDNINK